MPRHRHDPSKNFVGFLVGDVVYAVRIELVREIVNPLSIVGLPHAPASVRGVADYRGEVVPVVDLRERFALPQVTPTRRNKWIVVDVGRSSEDVGPVSLTGGRFVALAVDSVTEVFGAGGGEVRPAPPLGAGDDVRGIAGVTSHGKTLVFVLDVRAFSSIAAEVMDSIPPGALSVGAT
jgi:purine-binding chemotaxis protein CheW